MKASWIKLLLLLVLFNHIDLVNAQKVDPNHIKSGGYGYLVSNENNISLWWAEGAYKLMRDAPVPEKIKTEIELWSAKNEYEPFQLMLNPVDSLKDISINFNGLFSNTDTIYKTSIVIRKIEYVKVTRETDSYGKKGWWPDPLPMVDGTFTAISGENTGLFITVYIPETTKAGNYKGQIELTASGWKKEIPVKLTVWDFTLPTEPTIRSGFGLSVDKIRDYHNLTSYNDIFETFDLYMKAFRDYRISPYNFYALQPIEEKITGVKWMGGYFDSEDVYSGTYSLRIVDESMIEAIDARYSDKIPVDRQKKYQLSWVLKSDDSRQEYCVMVRGFNSDGDLLVFENKTEVFTGDTIWEDKKYYLGLFGEEVKEIDLKFFPAFRTSQGEHTGTVWVDDIILKEENSSNNMISQGDFEMEIDKIDIELDFKEFDKAASRYLDDFGFNAFRLNLKGMGGGTYFSRTEGDFAGFSQGTPEYEKLMNKYLSQIENHLDTMGWLGKEYIYWFDEPGQKDYPFVREGMETIKKSAPGITTFLTENDPGPDITDVTDITCTIWHKIDPNKTRKMVSSGQEYWSYLCTAPKSPWITEFIDHDAINLRMWLWMSYSYNMTGILVWSTNYWTSYSASPPGFLQNPWDEPMSFVQGYGWPLGKQTKWGNGDGRLWYPPNRKPNNNKSKFIEGPVPSLRIEFLRQGIEDYEYFIILESEIARIESVEPERAEQATKLLDIPEKIFSDGKTYTKNPLELLNYRNELADMIMKLKNIK